MELDDLKSTWQAETGSREQANTTLIIDQVTRRKFRSKLGRIKYPELAGSFVCLAAALFIGAHFYQLDTRFLQGVGIVSVALLLLLSAISFVSIRQLGIPAKVSQPYADVLTAFAKQKLRFYKLQKLNVTLGYLLLVTVIVLVSKFFGGKDLTRNKYFWTMSFTLGYIFLLFFSAKVWKHYKNTIRQTEELLHELEA